MKGEFCTVSKFILAQQAPPCMNCITSVFVRRLGLIPGLGRSPGDGKAYPLQYSGLENSMVCTVPGVAESDRTERLLLSVFVIFSFFFFCSKVFNTRKVWLLTLFYHILEFSVHLLFSSGLSLHLRLWNAICFSRGSLKGLLANPTPNNKNNKNKIPPPTIFPKPWSICLGNFYVIYYKILWLVICAQTWSFLYILSSLKAKII